jgi:chromosomal replication initiation ATPase DnaA
MNKIAGLTKHKQSVVSNVIALVAAEFSVQEKDLFTKSRAIRYSTPRSVAVGILRKFYGIQYQILADYFGYVSHGSVAHAVKSVDDKINTDPDIKQIVQNILHNVKQLKID